MSESNQPKEVSIGFMPAIPVPPTQKNLIEEIMKCYEMQKWTSARIHFSGGESGNI